MNSSFLLTSNKRFDKRSYLIPSSVNMKAIRLKSAIINFSEQNVSNHVFYKSFSDENEDVPAPNIREPFVIPDGHYTPDEYAKTMTELLMATAPRGRWAVSFDESTGKMRIEYNRDDGYVNNVYITFNEEASDYVGANFDQWLQWKKFEPSKKILTRNVLQLPRFYRICSNTLAQFGFMYDNSSSTNILGVVPVDYSRKWTSWENTDSFFHYRENNELTIYNLLDIEIFAEESIKPIVDPEFVLVFQIQR